MYLRDPGEFGGRKHPSRLHQTVTRQPLLEAARGLRSKLELHDNPSLSIVVKNVQRIRELGMPSGGWRLTSEQS